MLGTPALRAHAFRRSIRANLAYWRRSPHLASAATRIADADWRNIVQAIQYGGDERSTRVDAAEFAISLFDSMQRRGDYHEWAAVLQRLADRLTGQPALGCRLLLQVGQCHMLANRLPTALESLRVAERLACQVGDYELMARSQVNLCECLLLLQQDDAAEDAGRRALTELAPLEDRRDLNRVRATVLGSLGVLAGRRGRPADGEARLLEALSLLDDARDPLEVSRLCNLMAQLLWRAGRPAEALLPLDRALMCVSALPGTLLDQTWIRLTQGSVSFSLQRWADAEAAFGAIPMDALRRQHQWKLIAFTLNNLGNVYQQQGRLAEAEATLIEAVALMRTLEDDVELANYLVTLGEVLDAQDRRAEAEPLWREAVDTADRRPADARAQRYAAAARRYLNG